MSYAEATTVPFEKSVGEIVALIKRAGAMQIGQMDDIGFYAIQFVLGDRMIRFRLPLPSIDEMPRHNGRHQALSPHQRQDRLAQAKRSRARALLLVIKAKLESVESGIETLEQAFLAHVVMADGATVYERIAQPIALEYQSGRPDAVAGLLGGPAA
jgi:hypothetical protein